MKSITNLLFSCFYRTLWYARQAEGFENVRALQSIFHVSIYCDLQGFLSTSAVQGWITWWPYRGQLDNGHYPSHPSWSHCHTDLPSTSQTTQSSPDAWNERNAILSTPRLLYHHNDKADINLESYITRILIECKNAVLLTYSVRFQQYRFICLGGVYLFRRSLSVYGGVYLFRRSLSV